MNYISNSQFSIRSLQLNPIANYLLKTGLDMEFFNCELRIANWQLLWSIYLGLASSHQGK
jgi:hypothetical protein